MKKAKSGGTRSEMTARIELCGARTLWKKVCGANSINYSVEQSSIKMATKLITERTLPWCGHDDVNKKREEGNVESGHRWAHKNPS